MLMVRQLLTFEMFSLRFPSAKFEEYAEVQQIEITKDRIHVNCKHLILKKILKERVKWNIEGSYYCLCRRLLQHEFFNISLNANISISYVLKSMITFDRPFCKNRKHCDKSFLFLSSKFSKFA